MYSHVYLSYTYTHIIKWGILYKKYTLHNTIYFVYKYTIYNIINIRNFIHIPTYAYTYIHLYIYIYMHILLVQRHTNKIFKLSKEEGKYL